MNLKRIRRLIQLLGLLQSGKGQNAAALSAVCHVSRRTIFRDLDLLRQAGVPLLLDEAEGSYRIPGTYFLPPTNFTVEQALAVMLLCYELGTNNRLPYFGASQRAALKLESNLPNSVRDQLGPAAAGVRINLPPITPLSGPTGIYQQLLACISSHRCVRMEYDSIADRGLIRIKLCAYRLLFTRHTWYVIGRSSMHRAVRTFHLGRIRSLTVLNERFHMPRTFSIERHFGNAWHMIPGPEEHHVVVRFSTKVARNVEEVVWHKTQRIVKNVDGTVDFHAQISGLDEVVWWILGYGSEAEVLEPEELRQKVATHIRDLAARYNVRE